MIAPPDRAARLAYHHAREQRERRMAHKASDQRSRDVHLQLANHHKLEGLLLLLSRQEEAPLLVTPAAQKPSESITRNVLSSSRPPIAPE
ncbi:hypothetical protein [Sphingomonas aracearum]|uniref:Uncharacterized protein n=1 Tax=Sphingomonas aracearum TaxID=2283317 RepID=A0A369VY04_9SPHN|nr:hypothetical protein [Sphingomonas aracearum]RDE07188.1 hypothetical protein DVW87_05990 [Sphingomonas aracearum]